MADRHGSHDLAFVVAFADGELAGSTLDAAAAQVGDCPECAELVADLRSLAVAAREMRTPARPRDFTLTPADAERLGALGPEPHVASARLGLEMTDGPTTHAAHDPELIAAAVGGPLEAPQRLLADSLLAECATCAELHADLLAIARAERTFLIPARPRDFRLTVADAHRLRPRGFRAILAAIGSSRDAFSKPLAVGLTTLGLVGLLVGTVPSFGLGGAEALSTVGDAVSESTGDGTVFGGQDVIPSAAPSAAAAAPEPSAAPSAAPAAVASAASKPDPDNVGTHDASGDPREGYLTPAGDPATGEPTNLDVNRTAQTDGTERLVFGADGPSPLLIGSVLMLAVGLGLFVARWGARRLRGS